MTFVENLSEVFYSNSATLWLEGPDVAAEMEKDVMLTHSLHGSTDGRPRGHIHISFLTGTAS
jgi:hypothetical protein